jgi:Trk-type K+ transport system membrane component
VFFKEKKRKIFAYIFFTALMVIIAFSDNLYLVKSESSPNKLLLAKLIQYGFIFFLAIYEISKLLGLIYRKGVSSAAIFVSSFLLLILAGTGLLLLPRSTFAGIGITDAFFMTTSAVCVTGLATIPLTGFTFLGKTILLILIQIGGLGVMTFAGLIAANLSGQSSFQSQLALKDMISSNKLSSVLHNVNTIIGVSFIFELAGMLLIYITTRSVPFPSEGERIFFAIFHSISAFCNAGFSTMEDGIATPGFQTNYRFQWVIMVLIILGGMGFPIIFNLYKQIVHKTRNLIGFFLFLNPMKYSPRLLNLTSKIGLRTTIILLLAGFAIYMVIEWNFSLKEVDGLWGKITTAFFGSVTARTAGFNTIDFSTLRLPTLLFIIFLMWVGASPASTGGGIKTTTLAIAVINLFSVVRGKNRPEFNRREIGTISIRRAFAVILLSVFVISLCALGVALNDSHLGFLNIFFESFSAFSTVGLSLGITGGISVSSKIILSITMFLGRVGTLTLMASLVRQSAPLKYKYPTEEILI